MGKLNPRTVGACTRLCSKITATWVTRTPPLKAGSGLITSTMVASNPKEVAPLFQAKSNSSQPGISDPLCSEPEASVEENSPRTNA